MLSWFVAAQIRFCPASAELIQDRMLPGIVFHAVRDGVVETGDHVFLVLAIHEILPLRVYDAL